MKRKLRPPDCKGQALPLNKRCVVESDSGFRASEGKRCLRCASMTRKTMTKLRTSAVLHLRRRSSPIIYGTNSKARLEPGFSEPMSAKSRRTPMGLWTFLLRYERQQRALLRRLGRAGQSLLFQASESGDVQDRPASTRLLRVPSPAESLGSETESAV